VIAVAVVVLAAAITGVLWGLAPSGTVPSASPTPASTPSETPTPTPTAPNSVTVAAMGDMLAHDSINQNAQTANGGYDYAPFFSPVRGSYSDADIVFCNQEGLSSGAEFGISGYPAFNAPEQFAIDLKNAAGCNAISLANNHINDKGQAAINKTLDVWDSLQPLLISGAARSPEEQQEISYTTINGISVALVAFAQYSNNGSVTPYGQNIYGNEALLTSLVTTARNNADAVMVSMHWGTENSATVDNNQKTYAQLLADLGVDVVIGTGPHVLQPATWLSRADGHRTLVWYSIGNLLSTQLTLDQRIGGIAEWDFVRDPAGVVVANPRFIPTFMSYNWTAEQEAAGDLLARTDPRVYLLAEAQDPMASSRLGSTVAAQQANVAAVLGPDIAVRN
jgi:poly-gamma-glutamate capsule biosynthesis protein CapA/YwtB (metallophosphatase superfamily)